MMQWNERHQGLFVVAIALADFFEVNRKVFQAHACMQPAEEPEIPLDPADLSLFESSSHFLKSFRRLFSGQQRKSIKVGPEYQADLPSIQEPPTDILIEQLWTPTLLPDHEVFKYLCLLIQQQKTATLETHPPQVALQKLYDYLHTANYNTSEALNSILFGGLPIQTPKLDSYLTWEERRIYKLALFDRGKDFGLIQELWFPHKTCYQLTEFYYLWKKQEGFHTSQLSVQPSYYSDYLIEVIVDQKDEEAAAQPLPFSFPELSATEGVLFAEIPPVETEPVFETTATQQDVNKVYPPIDDGDMDVSLTM